MLMPNGRPANKIEKVMLLSMWARNLKDEAESKEKIEKPIILAGMGRPTYPISAHTVSSYLAYWKRIDEVTRQWRKDPDKLHAESAVDYGEPRGDKYPRELMAKVMSAWYETDILPENIVFTVGGIGGLHIVFETFNTHFDDLPHYRVITPFPYYSAYSNNPIHLLHPVEVMQEPGYRLTANALERSIQEAYKLAEEDHFLPKVVLICNPSNPLGNVIVKPELINIAEVLRKYPELYIVIDEAYIEMSFVDMSSLLNIAPDLKPRIILLRSATKALSAAGERMAILMAFDGDLLNELTNKSISYFIHAPRSAQLAYAETMTKFDTTDQKKMTDFYKKKVEYVTKRLVEMGATMPDPHYHVEATFYVMGDFSDLFGLDMPQETKRALQRSGKIQTGEDLAYYLLFQDGVMVAPMSYFGLADNSGFVRITCSAHQSELTELMNRLEHRLMVAREIKNVDLADKVQLKLNQLEKLDIEMFDVLRKKVDLLNIQDARNCRQLKLKNQSLLKLHAIMDRCLELPVIET